MTVRARKWRVVFVLCAANVICLAQSNGKQTKTEAAAPDPSATFSTVVNLVMVPVVVRDARGNAVGSLRREDFRLFDRGKPQTISAFSVESTNGAVRPGEPSAGVTSLKPAASTAAKPRAENFLAWLFDDTHMSFSEVAQVRAAAMRVLKEPLEPGTRAAVITTSGRLIQDFTADRDKLAQSISRLQPFQSGAGGPETCSNIGYFQADRIVNQDDGEARAAAEVNYAANCLHPGPKDWPSAMAEAHLTVRVLVQQALNLGRQASTGNLAVLKELIRRMAFLPGTRSIVLVSPGFFLADDRRSEYEADVSERAIRANVIINSLNSRGVSDSGFAAVGIPAALADVKRGFDSQQAYADEGVLQHLTEATGGNLVRNDNDYSGALHRSAVRPEYIYMLGFTPLDMKVDNAFRKLRVTLRSGSRLQLQARRGYFLKSSAMDFEERASEELKDAFFSNNEIQSLPVEMVTGVTRKNERISELSIVARVDLKGLHFRKVDGRNTDTLSVVTGVFDTNGKYVTGSRKKVDLKLTDETLGPPPQQGLTVETKLDVASGTWMARLVVSESEGDGVSAQDKTIDVP